MINAQKLATLSFSSFAIFLIHASLGIIVFDTQKTFDLQKQMPPGDGKDSRQL